MTEAQAEKLATADEAFEYFNEGPSTGERSRLAERAFHAGWSARQAEVDRLTAENVDMRERLDLARCEGCRFENDKLEKERDQLRELAGELVRHLHDHGCVINRPDSPYREPETALFAKAKALGIGCEG